MKKRILFVNQALWVGGIETALVNLLGRLDYDKYDVTCLLLKDEKPMADRLPEKCRLIVADRERAVSFPEAYRYARLYQLTEESGNPSALHRAMMWLVPVIRWVENRLYIRYIRRMMKQERFDTCVIYNDKTAETAVRAIRADRFLMFYHHGAMRRMYHDEIGYRKSEKIIAVSKRQEETLRQYRPRYAEKMLTVHNLTDVEGVRKKSTEPIPDVFAEDQFHIVSCGRVSPEKGMDMAVEACAKLVEAGHDNVRWWIVGGGPAQADVREKIARLHMEDHVTMVGMKENPYPYIAKADLYVQPSRMEAFGLTVVEAMILGRAVICTNTDGGKETVSDGVNGMRCTVSADAIANAVMGLMHNRQERLRYQENAAGMDYDAQNRKTMEQLQQLL